MPVVPNLKDKLEKENKPIPARYMKYTCVKCGTEKTLNKYYLSYSPLWKHLGHLGICKSCVGEYYDEYYNMYKDTEKAIYYICETVDAPFLEGIYKGAIGHSKKNNWEIYQSYFRQLNSLAKDKNPARCFHDSDTKENYYNKLDSDGEAIDLIDIEMIRDDLKKHWGTSFSDVELLFLYEESADWISRYDVSSKAMEYLIEQICYTQLQIRNKQQAGIYPDKELTALAKLMNNASLNPISESAAQSADQNTLGTWIKIIENEKPIKKVSKEFKDVDGIRKLIRVWFLGHFCKMQGIANELTEEYDREILKNSVTADGDV